MKIHKSLSSTEIVPDKYATLVNAWINHQSLISLEDINQISVWYGSREIKDSLPDDVWKPTDTLYRGLIFPKDVVLPLLTYNFRNSIELDYREYESWSRNPQVAHKYSVAFNNVNDDSIGIMLSRYPPIHGDPIVNIDVLSKLVTNDQKRRLVLRNWVEGEVLVRQQKPEIFLDSIETFAVPKHIVNEFKEALLDTNIIFSPKRVGRTLIRNYRYDFLDSYPHSMIEFNTSDVHKFPTMLRSPQGKWLKQKPEQ